MNLKNSTSVTQAASGRALREALRTWNLEVEPLPVGVIPKA